eukprot:342083-Rhodomonas_salina.2
MEGLPNGSRGNGIMIPGSTAVPGYSESDFHIRNGQIRPFFVTKWANRRSARSRDGGGERAWFDTEGRRFPLGEESRVLEGTGVHQPFLTREGHGLGREGAREGASARCASVGSEGKKERRAKMRRSEIQSAEAVGRNASVRERRKEREEGRCAGDFFCVKTRADADRHTAHAFSGGYLQLGSIPPLSDAFRTPCSDLIWDVAASGVLDCHLLDLQQPDICRR